MPTWLVHADRDRQRVKVHHEVGRGIEVNPEARLLQLNEQAQIHVQPKQTKH
ncbi:MAG: hypothetical protein MK075_04300 [Phycisphaerales bacterium]|nr:hypothetical protein [Phycisphaerales bacterium]